MYTPSDFAVDDLAPVIDLMRRYPLATVVARLVNRHEAARPRPWKMTDSEPAYITENLAGIVGLRLTVTRVEAKFKLGQNRTDEDRLGAAAGAGRAETPDLEQAMRAVKAPVLGQPELD